MSTLPRAESSDKPALQVARFQVDGLDLQFSESDVVNPDDYIPAGESNPHNEGPWFLHDSGFCLAVVFADCLQDAIDEAVDAGKLECFAVDFASDEQHAEWRDYGDTRESALENDRVSHLGNNGAPYDIESLGVLELPNPPFSFVALFNAREGGAS